MICKLWHSKKPSPSELIRQQFRSLLRDPARRMMVVRAINKGEDITVGDERGNSIRVRIISNHTSITRHT